MITDTTGKLSDTSKVSTGRDFFWILKNLKEIIKKQGLDEAAITALQNQLQTLTENGQMDTVEIQNALIHSLMVDSIFTPDTQTIRGITSAGKWVVGWYGKNTPPGISNTLGTAGEPSIVMLGCTQPNQEVQICAFWTDRSIAALYGQNETNLPYVAMGVDVDPAAGNPCLILEINQTLFDQFPNTEIILQSWAINFTPNNNAYKFDTTPKYRTALAGGGGFGISSLTFSGTTNFESIEVTEARIGTLEAENATVDGSPVVTETILTRELGPINQNITNEATARESADNLKVNKSGDTMTGALILNGDPTADDMAANKKYIDNKIAAVESNALTFKGFISTTEPTIDVREGNFWYQPAAAEITPDTNFPWQVKTYTSGAWSATTSYYIPSAGDRWANVDDGSSGWYYEGQVWHKLDFGGSVFNSTQFDTIGGEVSIKDGAITDDKIPVNANIAPSKVAGIPSTANNIAVFDETGHVKDSGNKITDVTIISPDYNSSIQVAQWSSNGNGSQIYWTADEDCYVLINASTYLSSVPMGNFYIYINGTRIYIFTSNSSAVFSITSGYLFLKRGDTISATMSNSEYSIVAFGIIKNKVIVSKLDIN